MYLTSYNVYLAAVLCNTPSPSNVTLTIIALRLPQLKLNNLRRAVLFSYNSSDQTIDFRHYTIKVVPVGISKGVKKLVNRTHVPNMGRLQDMADFVKK